MTSHSTTVAGLRLTRAQMRDLVRHHADHESVYLHVRPGDLGHAEIALGASLALINSGEDAVVAQRATAGEWVAVIPRAAIDAARASLAGRARNGEPA